MSKEWKCKCKDCPNEFFYSDTKYEAGRVRGWSRPERCDECRATHAREINSIGQAYYKVRTLRPILDPKRLTSDLGRFEREDRPHEAQETHPAPLDEKKFGVKDDRLIEELYLRAYVAKDNDAEAARIGFKLVVDILPAGDATADKAKRWLEKLDGKGPKDEDG